MKEREKRKRRGGGEEKRTERGNRVWECKGKKKKEAEEKGRKVKPIRRR